MLLPVRTNIMRLGTVVLSLLPRILSVYVGLVMQEASAAESKAPTTLSQIRTRLPYDSTVKMRFLVSSSLVPAVWGQTLGSSPCARTPTHRASKVLPLPCVGASYAKPGAAGSTALTAAVKTAARWTARSMPEQKGKDEHGSHNFRKARAASARVGLSGTRTPLRCPL